MQELLAEYAGTLLLVSHDRDFLDRVVTSTIVCEGDGRWAEYAGGYTDMLAQRGSDLGDPKPKEEPKGKEGKPSAPKRRQSRKLSNKQQRALETLPGKMEYLQIEIAALEGILADPELYLKDAERFRQNSEALTEKHALLAAAEEEWLELELLREELETGA